MHPVSRLLPLVALLAACADSASTAPPATSAPTPPLPTADPWAAVRARVSSVPVANLVVIVGDRSGRLLTIERGTLSTQSPLRIASVSKWLSGYGIYALTEQGRMSLADRPQRYLPFWTQDASDLRARVTLESLLAFTSGFNYPPDDAGCLQDPMTTVQQCAQSFYQRGASTEPGSAYFYGDAHLQIAGAMVERATGQEWRTFFATEVAPRIGLTTTQFSLPSQRNPRVAAGAVSTVNDMETFLRRLLRGELVRDLEAYRRERTAAATFLSTVTPLQVLRLDWRYGLGFWRECDDATWSSRCASSMVLSSPGGFGSTPWISFDEGYYAMIAMDEQIVAGEPASVASVRLEQALQPLISAALATLRR